MSSIAKVIAAIAAWAGILIWPTSALAQSDYPNKPVKLIVGFAPGGSTDIVARLVAQKLGERLGQTVIVENRAGAGGTIGADVAAKAPPDGYTLTLGTTSTHAIAPGAYSKLPYNPVTDFTQISLVAITPYLLVVNPQVPARNLDEFIALAKKEPGKMNSASAGNGTATHLAMEMLKDAAKNRPCARSVQRQRAGRRRDTRGRGAGRIRFDAGAATEHESEQGPSARSRNRDSVARAARGADGCRTRAIPASRRRCGLASWARPACEARRRSAVSRDRYDRPTPDFKAAMDANGAEPLKRLAGGFRRCCADRSTNTGRSRRRSASSSTRSR